ncbi:MAG: VIT1/CCC1 transporter family protein [Pseudomonadota bacterium]
MLDTNHPHTPEGIAARLNEGPKVHYLKEWVYGGIDGVVTTFAVVAAVIGADLSAWIVLIMGLANLVGDGFSMAASAFSGAKAEKDNYKRLRKVELSHIEKYPEGEREETRQLFAAKGFEGEELESMVDMISRDKDVWIEFMMSEEYGVTKPMGTPFQIGLHTFLAFLVCGSAPLIPYVFNFPQAPVLALAFSAITFFCIGAIKSRWSIKSWWVEGFTTTLIGLIAALLAYAIGFALSDFIPS